MTTIYDTIIIGAGQAGLATGYHLQQAGLRFLILEAGQEPAGSWPHYFDSVALNSAARYSALPGLPFPGDPDRYPVRDEVAAYLRQYAAHFKLPIVTKARVSTVERIGRLFRVITTGQGCYLARTVVAATGFFGRPHMPDLPGQTGYQGRLLHAANYRNPEPFRGQRVIVVGGGNGAVQIALELAQVAQVSLASRGPIRYLPQRLLNRDIHFWLRLLGLDNKQWLGNRSMLVYDPGHYRAAIAAGRPDRQPLFERFTEDGVIWGDSRSEPVDAVIFATGYRPYLPYLAGVGALDETGQVLHHHGTSATVPGLYYVGLFRQRSVASTTLRGVGRDAKNIVTHLRRYLEGERSANGSIPSQRGWAIRSGELAGLIGLISLAFKEQFTSNRISAPRLVGEAVMRSLIVGAGFLGVGQATALYTQN